MAGTPNAIGRVPKPLPIGIDDYAELVAGGYWLADKTSMIKEILDTRPKVLLFCRPRRFGKTLNMSMLRYFFERSTADYGRAMAAGGCPADVFECPTADHSSTADNPGEPSTSRSSTAWLFEDKAIWAAGERYRSEQGRYPVVWLTLKDLHYASFSEAREAYAELISRECARHPELAQSDRCLEADRGCFSRLLAREPKGIELEGSLSLLTRMLHVHWGEPTVLIIDEYDALIQEGYARGYYDEAVTFVRNLFGPALKTNPDLKYAFLTGILRVAKESIFSGLNNVKVDTVMDRPFAPSFGLTEDEAAELLAEYGQVDKLPLLLEWYDGYHFGDIQMLNPWSALSFVDGGCEPLAYWVDTSGNAIIGEVLEGSGPETRQALEGLLQGGIVETTVNTSIIYPEIRRNPDSVWSFLLITGYLTARSRRVFEGEWDCELAIPNREVKTVFSREVIARFLGTVGSSVVRRFRRGLMMLDAADIEGALRQILLASTSYFDTPSESFFHGLMLGLCAVAGGDYRITSNRESGLGRYDLQMEPKRTGLPGVLAEIKIADRGEGIDEAASRALVQIRERGYAPSLRARGISRIACFGMAFEGKDSRVAMEVLEGQDLELG